VASAVLMALMFQIGMRAQAPAGGATAADVVGRAERRIARNPDRWTPLKVGDVVAVDSAVQTAADSAVLLSLPGQHVMRVGENTTLELKELGENHSYFFSLLKGRIWSFVDKANKPTKYEIEAASVILGVSGTLFSVSRDETDNEVEASVDDGQVRLRRGRLEKTLGRGFQLRVLNSRLAAAAPRKQTKATLAMWKSVGTAESWSKPHGTLRLHKEVEARAREVREERRREKAGAGRAGGRGRRGSHGNASDAASADTRRARYAGTADGVAMEMSVSSTASGGTSAFRPARACIAISLIETMPASSPR
jgi:FecR-like protein